MRKDPFGNFKIKEIFGANLNKYMCVEYILSEHNKKNICTTSKVQSDSISYLAFLGLAATLYSLPQNKLTLFASYM